MCIKTKFTNNILNAAITYFWAKVDHLLKLFYQTELIEAGCDEAGRGCLAGPVFAAAVIPPEGFYHEQLNDSKQVNEKNRYELRTYIEKNAISYHVAMVDHEEIDRINILNASFKAMHLAVDKLKKKAQFLIIETFVSLEHRRNLAHLHRRLLHGISLDLEDIDRMTPAGAVLVAREDAIARNGETATVA